MEQQQTSGNENDGANAAVIDYATLTPAQLKLLILMRMCSKWRDPVREEKKYVEWENIRMDSVAVAEANEYWLPPEGRGLYNQFLLDHFDVYKGMRAAVVGSKPENSATFEQQFLEVLRSARDVIYHYADDYCK